MEAKEHTLGAEQSAKTDVEHLQDRIQMFVQEQFKKLKDAHFIHNNTVQYHSCCNTFTLKGSKSRKRHMSSQTLSDFFGKPKNEVTQQLMIDLCLSRSQSLPGSRHMSTPTVNQHHQDNVLLDKRLCKAEVETTEVIKQQTADLASFDLMLKQLRDEKRQLEDSLKAETERAEKGEIDSLIYSNFLRYNNIDPEKVLSGWAPRDGLGEKILLRWPKYTAEEGEASKQPQA